MTINKLKQRMSNIFRSPLCSRRRKAFSDVTQHPFFYPHNNQHPFQLNPATKVKPRHRKSRKKRNNSQLKNKKFEELLDSVSGYYSNYWFTISEDENEGQDDDDDYDDRTALLSGFVDSYAVVKRSSDPYNEFRTSMVEMIVERQLFRAKDLEHLLHCFLALNSASHHMVIVEAFAVILETIFGDWE